MFILKCECCGREFQAKHRRKITYCKECAEYLRAIKWGPRQTNKKHVVQQDSLAPKKLDWSVSKDYLFYYLNRFRRFPVYDGVFPKEINEITDEDRILANKIAARMGRKTWIPLIGKSIREIGQWNLLSMNDSEWQTCVNMIRNIIENLLVYPGIGVARLTKALHRKRPNLIPICDSVLCDALNVRAIYETEKLIECMNKLRLVGRAKINTLNDLRRVSLDNNTELSQLRILELLYWVQYGPFPPPHLRK